MSRLLKTILLVAAVGLLQANVHAYERRYNNHRNDGGRHENNRYESHRPSHYQPQKVWHGDIRVFNTHDLNRWRGGRWYHGFHEGRQAWWWIVGGLWYLHTAPVYPYPDPYQPPVVVVQQPPVTVIQQPQSVMVPVPSNMPAPQPQTTQYWNYCNNPQGYYPYVPQCQTEWVQVPATPIQ